MIHIEIVNKNHKHCFNKECDEIMGICKFSSLCVSHCNDKNHSICINDLDCNEH